MAICAAALVFQTLQLLQLPFNLPLALLVFCATLCSYNFHYLIAGSFISQRQFTEQLRKKKAAVFTMIAGAIGLLLLVKPSQVSITDLGIAVLLTLVYSIPLLPFKQVAFTRKAGFLKTLLLAFTWMFVTAYLPLSQHHLQFTTGGLLIITKRFLFVLMLCILFDNRDVAVDEVYGLHSLATDLKPKTMQWLITTVFALLFILNFFLGRYGGVQKGAVTALQVSAMITLVVYFFSRKKQGYFFYYFIVDGMMVLMTLLTTIASI